MVIFIITLSILILTSVCVAVMVLKLSKQSSEAVSFIQYMKLIVSGIIAFIADTLGVGSFAVNITLAKLMGTFRDDEMPAVNNGAQVIPGVIESFFFINLINVDLTTLITLVLGTAVGGLIGGFVLSSLSKQATRLAMVGCFALIILLLLSHQYRLLPVGGELTELHSWKLVIGFFAMMVCGALTSVGVGLFVMVQCVLFLLNVSPVLAFPIMTTAGAMQQPLTTLVFLRHNKIPLKKTMILSISGCFGVLITIPIFMRLTVAWLQNLVLCLLIFNFFAVGLTYLRSRTKKHYMKQSTPISAIQ